MAREKSIKIRLSDKEYERLERIAQSREVPMAQLFREFLKSMDSETELIAGQ